MGLVQDGRRYKQNMYGGYVAMCRSLCIKPVSYGAYDTSMNDPLREQVRRQKKGPRPQ